MFADIIHNDDSTNFSFRDSITIRACGYEFCKDSSTIQQLPLVEKVGVNHKLSHKINVPILTKQMSSSTGCDLQSHNNNTETDSQKSEREVCEQIFKKIEQNYKDHKIDNAYKLVVKFIKACKSAKISPNAEEQRLMKKINSQMEDVLHYQHIINEEGWKLQKEKKNLRVSTKIQDNTVGVLIEAQLDIPIQHFLSVLIEVDLMKNYMPFMQESKQEKIVSRNCRIGHSINNFPILSKREAFFQGIGYDRMDHNKTVILFSRSLNDRPDLQELLGYKVKPTKGAVQLDYRYVVMEYRPTGPKQGSLKMALNIDLKVRLPMWILEPATENFGVDFYKNILKIAKNFQGSAWEERAKQNPDFFNLVNRRVGQLFAQQNIQDQDI